MILKYNANEHTLIRPQTFLLTISGFRLNGIKLSQYIYNLIIDIDKFDILL